MRPLLFSLIGLSMVGLAKADDPLLGRYVMRMQNDAQRVARLRDKTEQPYGLLTFREGHRFVLDTQDDYRRGRYIYDEGRLVLLPSSGGEIRASVRGDEVNVEGQTFDRESDSATSGRRFPTDVSTGRVAERTRRPVERDEPVDLRRNEPLPAPVTVVVPNSAPVEIPVVVAKAPVVVAPAAPARRRLLAEDIAGGWTVRRNGYEEKTWRMDLRKDGTFRFTMKGLTSEGTWNVDFDEIVLTYRLIDGEPLEEGAPGVKRIPCSFDGSAFQIDTYRYERASGK